MTFMYALNTCQEFFVLQKTQKAKDELKDDKATTAKKERKNQSQKKNQNYNVKEQFVDQAATKKQLRSQG